MSAINHSLVGTNVNTSLAYSGIGSTHQSIVGAHKLPGNPTPNIKQRGISISKSNRDHKLGNNNERSAHANSSAIYQTEQVEESRRTITSQNLAAQNGLNQYSAEFYYQFPTA